MKDLTLDLTAFKRYSNHIHLTGSKALDVWNSLTFLEQCQLAMNWQSGKNYQADTAAAVRDNEIYGDNN